MDLAHYIARAVDRPFDEIFSPFAPRVRISSSVDGTTIEITHWDDQLGPQPSVDEIRAVLAAPEPVDLPALKTALCADIDARAQAIRDRYVTPGGAQAATYLFKQTQAVQAQAAQASTDLGKSAADLAAAYPYLSNEIGVTIDPQTNAAATDIYGVMRAVIATVQVWQPLNLAIERVRLAAKTGIMAAATPAAAQAVHDAVDWPGST